MRVGVVGAGLAGLAAAVELKELGHHVELFERSRLLGGRATSFEIDGVEVDNGQHVFLACCTEFIRFARNAGFERHLSLQPRFEALVLDRTGKRGRLSAARFPQALSGLLRPPLHLAPSFATYPHLSLISKLRIAQALQAAAPTPCHPKRSATPTPRPSERSAALTPCHPERSAAGAESKDATTFEAWLQRNHQTPDTRRGFWNPFFIPALNAPFDAVGVDDALFTLRTAFLGDPDAARFGYARVPLAHLAAAAAKGLDAVHLSTPVLAVTPEPRVAPEPRSRVTLSLSKGGSPSFDAVVLAVPPPAVAKLLGDASAYGVEHLGNYDAYPILDVHLWHDAGKLDFDFAAALDSPLQWIFEKAPGYLSCSFSAANDFMNLATAELERLAWNEVQAFVPALRGATLVRSAVTRNPEATWIVRPAAARTAQRTAHPAVAIAGSWTDTGWPDTMESAVRSAHFAAQALCSA
jgi:phytoene dehydrogenase-like protein